jgi:hypothetical protein
VGLVKCVMKTIKVLNICYLCLLVTSQRNQRTLNIVTYLTETNAMSRYCKFYGRIRRNVKEEAT